MAQDDPIPFDEEVVAEEALWPNYSTVPPDWSERGGRNYDAEWAGVRDWWLKLPEDERPTHLRWWEDPKVLRGLQMQGIPTQGITADRSLAEAAPGPSLTTEEIDTIRQQMREHADRFRALDLPPSEERQFLKDFKDSPWARSFQRAFGAPPDPNDPTYDYRAAWKAGIMPGAGEHWPTQDGSGRWLKAPDHPTAWKEYYQTVTGQDPDVVGVGQTEFERMMGQPMTDLQVPTGEAQPAEPTEPTPGGSEQQDVLPQGQTEESGQIIPLAQFVQSQARRAMPRQAGLAGAIAPGVPGQ